uniref:(northern house mosquito) hypothetical protein n=1 Tax=Culex pipiens TaxID=7175 RepID=A0A8D8C1P3_CULPI
MIRQSAGNTATVQSRCPVRFPQQAIDWFCAKEFNFMPPFKRVSVISALEKILKVMFPALDKLTPERPLQQSPASWANLSTMTASARPASRKIPSQRYRPSSANDSVRQSSRR